MAVISEMKDNQCCGYREKGTLSYHWGKDKLGLSSSWDLPEISSSSLARAIHHLLWLEMWRKAVSARRALGVQSRGHGMRIYFVPIARCLLFNKELFWCIEINHVDRSIYLISDFPRIQPCLKATQNFLLQSPFSAFLTLHENKKI